MKINKLLFFLLAVFSLNSCVEYVDNGTKPDGPEKPEEQNFKAEHSNPEEAKYAGDIFKFKAMLNNVDVTATTKFKVNGTNISGNSYTAVKLGSNSVIATMDNFTANFKFDVLEKEDEPEPEPTGNRIEYDGESYPVSETVFVLHAPGGTPAFFEDANKKVFTMWAMASSEYDSNDKVINQYLNYVYVPVKGNGDIAFPNESAGSLDLELGFVTINGTEAFEMANVSYTFASGNTVPQNWMTQQPPWTGGKGNYTSDATGETSGESAKLFWNGDYIAGFNDLMAKGKTGNSFNAKNIKSLKNLKNLKNTQFIKLKK